MPEWFDETDAEDLIIRFAVENVATRRRTAFQDLVIFDTARFGRALALDGIVQLTEADEPYYHEMLVHVPLLAHGAARRVLVVGGGDGGAVREVLRHAVDEVVMVELDRQVTEACREHLPSVNAGAFEDPRLDLRFEDGVDYVARCERPFDVILIDSTDPLPGPGEVLFREPFYRACHRILAPGGVLISQFGVPFLYPDAVRTAADGLARSFADASLYVVAVPVFVGGYMAFGWASDEPGLRALSEETLAERLAASGLEPRVYTPAFHRAAFVLPRPIAELLD
ncbi:MAG: polyamine aminopropyltransferase [Kiloniellales bacterium]|nr:polyamine aminopropyltransferase [Kiloniellales bacterium]